MYYIHTSVCATISSSCIATLSTTAAINMLLLRMIMLVVPGTSPAEGENLSNREQGFIAHRISLSPSNSHDMAIKPS